MRRRHRAVRSRPCGLLPGRAVVLWYNRCVPDFTPFAGIRYDRERFGAELDAIVAPPYDVIDDELQATLEAADERNSVRLILPRDGSAVDDRYERAAATCARWLDEGALVRDTAPRFYAYRMEYDDPHGARRHTRGVIGAMTLPESGDDSVLPHERTLPKAKSDRLSLLRATRAERGPDLGPQPRIRADGIVARGRAAGHRDRS